MPTSSDTLLPQLRFPPVDGDRDDDKASGDCNGEAPAVESRKQVHLPPLVDSNFVVHYRETDFHVHTVVLVTQSAYFRNALGSQTLREVRVEDVVEQGKKRRKVTAFTSLLPCAKCGPSSLVRCIDVLEEENAVAATAEEEFLLFLRHLYFSSTLHLPPWVPKAEIVSALTDATAFCPAFPSTSVDVDELESYASEAEDGTMKWSAPLLSLFHHFNCQAALRRCDAAIACQVRVEDSTGLSDAWYFLPIAVRYGLGRRRRPVSRGWQWTAMWNWLTLCTLRGLRSCPPPSRIASSRRSHSASSA